MSAIEAWRDEATAELFGAVVRLETVDEASAFFRDLCTLGELHDMAQGARAARATSPVKIIGSPELARHYQTAATPLGLAFEVIDAQDAFLSAMAHFQSHGKSA